MLIRDKLKVRELGLTRNMIKVRESELTRDIIKLRELELTRNIIKVRELGLTRDIFLLENEINERETPEQCVCKRYLLTFLTFLLSLSFL